MAPPPPPLEVRLRAVTDDDRDPVLALNEAEVALLAPMDEARLAELRELCDRFDVVEVDGAFGGFVITFGPGSAYDSENYRWFQERYDDFAYLDRFVLDPSQRRRGIGNRVYDELEASASAAARMCLEVNIVPPNEPSLAFHRRRGYVEVGQLGDADHAVSLMEKPL